jgi:O-antigen ligase
MSVALGAIRRNLALLGGAVLAAAALAAAVLKADGWDETTKSMLLLLLALAIASSVAIRPLGVIRVVLRVAVFASLTLVVVDPDAASSPLATRYFLEDLPFRFRGFLNHPVALSTAAALLFVIAICVRYRSSLRVLDAAAALAAVALSDTRSGAIAIGLAIAGRVVLTKLDHRRPSRRFILVAVPAGLVAAQIGMTVWAAGRVDSLLQTTSQRSLIWDWCWDAAVQRPWLGADPALLAGGRYSEVAWWHCHDQVLSTAYHLGLAGLAGLMILLAGLIAHARAQEELGQHSAWLALCVVLALGIFETPLGFLGDAQSTFLTLIAVLLVAGGHSRSHQPEPLRRLPNAPWPQLGPLTRRAGGWKAQPGAR